MTYTEIICLTGGKGGTGKTTTAINLGAALNYFGKDVTIVDANLTTPNIGIHLGAPVVPIHLHHVLQGKHKISEAVYIHHSGTKIVPASISLDELRKTKPDRLKSKLLNLVGLTDIILIDSAAGLGREALAAIEAADELIIVTNPELPAVTDALKTIRLAQRLKKRVRGVVLTRTKQNNLDIPNRNVESLLERNIIAVIPEDESVREALTLREPVVYSHPKSPAAIAYKTLAASLIGKKYSEKIEKQSFFKKLLKNFRLK